MSRATDRGVAGWKSRDQDHHDGDPADEDARLMVAFGEGDEEAFVILYRRYRDRIVAYARRLLGDPARAEEAAQDVFLKVFGARRSYAPRGRFSTFLYRIATNHCLNLRARHEHRWTDRSVAADERAAVPPAQAAELARADLRRTLGSALDRLPDKQRAALVLCHYEGLTLAEAAAALQVSVSAVKSLVHRARERLAAELGGALSTIDDAAGDGRQSLAEFPHAL